MGSAKGKPQATKVRRSSGYTNQSSVALPQPGHVEPKEAHQPPWQTHLQADLGETCFGIVKEIKGHLGFISCTHVMEAWGKDVFCPATVLQNFGVGTGVEFELMVNAKGQPQASNVRTSTLTI